MKQINIKELAAELNLSVSTISKALRNSYEISEGTKSIVHQTAARLNYIPNPYASSLRGRQSKNIGVVIPEVADSFFSLALNGIESVAKENGYHVLIYLTHESFENERTILNELGGRRVDGVLLSVSRETAQTAHINDLLSKGMQLVFFDRDCEDVETAKVTTNDFESGYRAAEHLIQQGCDKIAFLSISNSLSISNKRLQGYRQALNDHAIKKNASHEVHCGNGVKQNYSLIKRMLQQKGAPNGIVASVEKLTIPIYEVCRELGLRIPNDVKVICFSNLETASILSPSLTTITQPAFEMGRAAASLLFKSLTKASFNLSKENWVIPSSLIVRASTGN